MAKAVERCPATSPGGVDKEGTLPTKGTQCGNYKGHRGHHTVLIPSGAPWAKGDASLDGFLKRQKLAFRDADD